MTVVAASREAVERASQLVIKVNPCVSKKPVCILVGGLCLVGVLETLSNPAGFFWEGSRPDVHEALLFVHAMQ